MVGDNGLVVACGGDDHFDFAGSEFDVCGAFAFFDSTENGLAIGRSSFDVDGGCVGCVDHAKFGFARCGFAHVFEKQGFDGGGFFKGNDCVTHVFFEFGRHIDQYGSFGACLGDFEILFPEGTVA